MEENRITVNSYMSDTIGEISAALSEFQGSIEQPKLEKEVSVRMKSGGTYKFKYADLSACVKAAAPQLKANGLAVAQIVSNGKLITILSHKSGEWIKSELMLPQQSSDYQAYGSAITYLKRYSYCAILGIVADTDDDANMASGNGVEMKDRRTNKSDVSSIAYTGEQLKQAIAEIRAAKDMDEFGNVWTKWANTIPSLCYNGTEFYKIACQKSQELQKVG